MTNSIFKDRTTSVLMEIMQKMEKSLTNKLPIDFDNIQENLTVILGLFIYLNIFVLYKQSA